MSRNLPPDFLRERKPILGAEWEDFLQSYDTPRAYGLRRNPFQGCDTLPFSLKPVAWAEDGYYFDPEERPGRHPLHEAGAYYIQEPSAMSVVSLLDPQPGELVCDLCAAPGGKSTHIAALLRGQGMLVSNEIFPNRARILSQNIERMGIPNALVCNESPEGLATHFPLFFHRIVVDAPCSGEGMFRKEEALARDWTPEKSQELATIQRELILQAADMLRPGGQLLYSTCTFAPDEDEGVVSWLLENRPDMELIELPSYEGFTPGVPEWGNGNPRLTRCVHLFPHTMQGEGHFMALFRKEGRTDLIGTMSSAKSNADTRKWLELFLKEIGLKTLGGKPFDWNRVETRKDKVYYLPPLTGDFRGLTFLRNGLYLGDLKKNRFEPSEPFALALHKDDAEAVISLPVSDERLTRYLKGETLNIEPEEAAHTKGWHLLCADGYPIGFGKLVGATLKNKYPAGWRV